MAIILRGDDYKGSEVVGFEAVLEDGRKVTVLPYARVEKDGGVYVLCTVAEQPNEAIVLSQIGDDMVQITGKLADELVKAARR